jgi:hypothetical protein
LKNEPSLNGNTSSSRSLWTSSKLIFGETSLAAGENFTRPERGFVHEPMGVMVHPVNATPGHALSRHKLLHLLPRDQAQIEPQVFRSDAGIHILSCSIIRMFSCITYVITHQCFCGVWERIKTRISQIEVISVRRHEL